MANEAGKNERRLAINFWDGVNAVVDKGVAKLQEPLHTENARSKIVGTLEKREGQTVLGLDQDGGEFVARENYDLAFVSTGFTGLNGLYRISGSDEPPYIPTNNGRNIQVNHELDVGETYAIFVLNAFDIVRGDGLTINESVTVSGLGTLSVDVFDAITITDAGLPSVAGTRYYVALFDSVSLEEPDWYGTNDSGAFYIDNTDYVDGGIYRLNSSERWLGLEHENARNLATRDFSHTVLDGNLYLVNGRDYNRYVTRDGATVLTSKGETEAEGLGNLFNTPKAALINSYKSRLYLANFEWLGQHLGNTVLQSSTPLGIVSLIQGDVTSLEERTDEDREFSGDPTQDLTTNLEGYFKLDETSGNAVDQIASVQLTNNNGVVYTGGKIMNGAVMTKVDEKYLSVVGENFNLDGDADFTIAGWIKLNAFPTNNGEDWTLFWIGDSGDNVSYEIEFQDDPFDGTYDIAATRWRGSSGNGLSKAWAPELDTWYHIALQYQDSSSVLGIFINGERYTSTAVTGGNGVSSTTQQGFAIGANIRIAASEDQMGNVSYDEVGIWSKLLSTDEIRDLYNAGAGRTYGFPRYWKLPITDSTYIYDDENANLYEIWRLNTKVADCEIYDVDDLYIYTNEEAVTWDPDMPDRSFLSQDQVFVKGTVRGEKIRRWPNNPVLTGTNVKQYNTFDLSGGDESDITVMTNIGNVMLLANKNTMASWNGSVLNNFDLGIGIPSRRGYVKAYGALYFIHYTGVYATSGQMPTILSSPIEPYLTGATKEGIDNAVGGVKGRSLFFAIGDVTLYKPDGSVKRTLRNVCLEYNILQQNWYIHTNVSVAMMESFLDNGAADRLAFADDTTKDVKTFLEGNTDDGEEIFMRVDTQSIPIAQNIEDLSNPQHIIVESERGSAMDVFVSLDEEDYYQLEGQVLKGVSKLKVNDRDISRGQPPVARTMAVSVRDSSKQRSKLGRMAVTFVPVGASNTDQ